MKILFLFSQLPFPLDTGAKIRTYNLLHEIGNDCEVTLACYARNPIPGEIAAVDKIVARLTILPNNYNNLYGNLRAGIIALAKDLPFTVAKYSHRKARSAVETLLSQEAFDLVHVDQPHMAALLPRKLDVPVVLNQHNIESQVAERCRKNEKSLLKKLFLNHQAKSMAYFEQSLWRCSDRVVTVSELDKNQVAEYTKPERIDVIPNGVDLHFFQPRIQTSTSPIIVFTGSMDWHPNQDAVIYFTREIFPIIRKSIPNTIFTVVGRKPPRHIRKLGELTNVFVTGTVPDVRRFLWDATVAVVPLRTGGGTRLKILEAMAQGTPVVSTAIGAEGLELTDGQHLFVEDNEERFASRVIELIRTPQLQLEIAKNALAKVNARYSWKAIAKRLAETYTTVSSSLPTSDSSRNCPTSQTIWGVKNV